MPVPDEDGRTPAPDLIDAQRRDPLDEAVPMGVLLPAALATMYARAENTFSTPTGFQELDTLLGGGLSPGTLTVVASRPSMGTSSLLLHLCRVTAFRRRRPVVLAGYQMPGHELALRLLSAETSVPLGELRAGTMGLDDSARVVRRTAELAGAPLSVITPAGWTATHLTSYIADLSTDEKFELVVVDGLDDVRPWPSDESRDPPVTEAARALKELAMELKVPVVAGAQLGGRPEERADRRPGPLTDFRRPDAVGHIADVVIMVHREDAYEPGSSRAGEADLIVAKHRHGPKATVTVTFEERYGRFADPSVS
ncbi:DnaB-like helicase C-terminal domain-containing protein [Nonomuraea sp. NPDC049695]|uniref:DnaB-like helicase C-terminal domain-containing protein n=1 Tax=Nonomuraea sp. NPDC049695 TaxID=3154734 RepID=UPI003431358D